MPALPKAHFEEFMGTISS